MLFNCTDPPPPASDVHLTDINLHQLTIAWSPVIRNCPSVNYNIIATNCGTCPSITAQTTVTCTGFVIDGRSCTVSVEPVVCGNVLGFTTTTTVNLRGQYVN